MTYTEIKKRNNHIYYYRAISVRKGNKVSKKRIYLGVDISTAELKRKENKADKLIIGYRELEKITSKIRKILLKHKVKKAGIFGSYAKGKQKNNSDIDIIIEPPANIGFGFTGIELELEKKLHRKVDLVSYNSLSPYLKEEILKTEVRII